MSVFLFVTANEHEREAFESKFTRQKEKYILGKTYYLGQFGLYPAAYIHVGEQGVTNPASMPLVSQLVHDLSPAAVVMVGIVFGVNEQKQKIGDVLVSDKILPYDSQKILENRTEYKETPKEVGFQLLNAFREYRDWRYCLPNSEQSMVYIGSILTGSRLVNNYKYRSQLISDFQDYKPIGGEMEAQGIYSMCKVHGVTEWIIVKGICDWGYKKNTPNKDVDQIIAANAAVDYCFHVFSRDGVFESLIKCNKGINGNRTISIGEYEEKPLKEESVNSDKVTTECDNFNSESTKKSIKEGSILESSIELVKNVSGFLETGRLTSLNITINDIKGDNYNDNSTDRSLGNENTFNGPVYMGGK